MRGSTFYLESCRGASPFTDIRIERLGLARFVEAGSVAGSLDALPRARVHADYGIGFRMALEHNATFRVDAGSLSA